MVELLLTVELATTSNAFILEFGKVFLPESVFVNLFKINIYALCDYNSIHVDMER